MKILVNSRVRLNGVGLVGAALFVGGLVIATLNYLTLLRRVSSGSFGSAENFVLVVSVCALAFLVGFVLLLIGREYDHTVEVDRETR